MRHAILVLCARVQVVIAATRAPTSLEGWKERRTNTTIFPLGPYHPALSQPLALTLRLRGESIVAVEPPGTGYCRRGINESIEGLPIAGALPIIERSCSLAGTSHRIALCQAIECASGAKVGRDARITRVLFAEIERILSRLWLLGWAARAANLPRLYEAALDHRETLFAALATALDERVYWAIAIPGGVADDLDLDILHAALKELAPIADLWRAMTGPKGALGRAGKGVGAISTERAEDLHLRGLVASGSGADDDLRRQKTASGYSDLTIDWPNAPEAPAGDVAARLTQAAEDIVTSFAITERCFEALGAKSNPQRPAPITLPASGKRAEGHATVEGPHGPVTVSVTLTDAGALTNLTLDPPSAPLVAALPDLLPGASLSQTPLILASLDLCMECFDH